MTDSPVSPDNQARMKMAAETHANVPPDWYEQSIRTNLLQRFWHGQRFAVVQSVTEDAQNVLDIGSADGVFSHVIAEAVHAKTLTGVEVLRSSVSWANERWKETIMKFQVGDAHVLQFSDGTFDAAFCLEMLEHVESPEVVLREMKRVVKKGGYVVLLVPSDNLLFRCIWSVWTKLRGAIWHDTHIQTFRGRRLPRIAREAGFTVEVDRTFLLGMLHLVKARA